MNYNVNDSTTKLDPNKLVQFNPQKPNNGVNSNEKFHHLI